MSEQLFKPLEEQQLNLTSPIQSAKLEDFKIADREPISFRTNFQGTMEMYSDEETVTNYLNNHQGWFVRCAAPMTAEPFGKNGYTLIIGRYGAFGYEVEPQMSVILEPPQERQYVMYSVPNPAFNHPGYEVDYRSEMYLESIDISQGAKGVEQVFQAADSTSVPAQITRINWNLQLEVRIRFPRFIYRLPLNVIIKTGDRLLAQIIKQVSPRLSYKVQKDFHTCLNLPIPPKTARTCEKARSY